MKSFLGKEESEPYDLASLDVDNLIAEVDPILWETVYKLTQSKSERKKASRVNDPECPAHHNKKVRSFYLLCLILFCTDSRCSLPLHTLITDIIDSQQHKHRHYNSSTRGPRNRSFI